MMKTVGEYTHPTRLPYNNSMDEGEQDFLDALQDAVNECRRIGYKPTGFMGMIANSNAFEAVRTLLHKREPSDGFSTLWEKGRLDLTVEAIVLKPEWRGYFTEDERKIARRRLADVKYRAPWDDSNPVAPVSSAEIESLLAELVASRGDRSAGKRIRSRLRTLGHYGGLRQRENDIERGKNRSTVSPGMDTKPESPLTLPMQDAESFISRIRSLVGLPERNHEDVVKELLVRLGFDAGSIVFQKGRIDLCVLTEDRKAAAVFEVKRTIAVESERMNARRQGMDYAMQTGALIVVVTDGDRYEVYDRRRGHDYDAMLCGKFQLTDFRASDEATFDLLRPNFLRTVRA
jgi:hypothetical protein